MFHTKHWLKRRHRRRSMARTLISDTFGQSGSGRSCMWRRTPRRCSIVPRKDVLSTTTSTKSLFESTTHRRGVYVSVTAASRSVLLAAHLSAFRVRRSYSESYCTFQVLRVPVQETSFFARIPGCQLSQAVESRKHVR